jgi:hypothetical protein
MNLHHRHQNNHHANYDIQINRVFRHVFPMLITINRVHLIPIDILRNHDTLDLLQ